MQDLLWGVWRAELQFNMSIPVTQRITSLLNVIGPMERIKDFKTFMLYVIYIKNSHNNAISIIQMINYGTLVLGE